LGICLEPEVRSSSKSGVPLAALAELFLTAGKRKRNSREERVMRRIGPHQQDSLADAAAIFILILLAVGTAVFWVSHQ